MSNKGCMHMSGGMVFVLFLCNSAVWQTSCVTSTSTEACVLMSCLEYFALMIWRIGYGRCQANEDLEDFRGSWEHHRPNKVTLGSPSKHGPVLHSLQNYPYYSQSSSRFKPCSCLTCLVASRKPAEFVCLGAGGNFVDFSLYIPSLSWPLPVLFCVYSYKRLA